MPDAPLSHHEMLALAAPFARRGRAVDMPACDRAAGRLQFAPRLYSGGWRDVLALQRLPAGGYRLLRTTVIAGCPLQATLEATGPEPAALPAAVDAVPTADQWRSGPGWVAAFSQADGRVVKAELQAGGVHLCAGPPLRYGRSARLVLQGPATVPDDLLAVLGWAWSPLVCAGNAWRGSVRLAGHGLEARVVQAAAHLSATLAEPPAAFHARQCAARWRVLARRSVPLTLWLGLAGLAAAAPELREARDTAAPLLALLLPPALLGLFCVASESPRLELPPLPRPLAAATW